MENESKNKHIISYVLVAASCFLYAYIAYFLERTEFVSLALCFTILFYFGYKILLLQKDNWRFLIAVVVLFRLLFIAAIPNLSQDFYRFIWDGRLILEGMNPYLYLPNDLMLQEGFSKPISTALYEGMGNLSASHYSNYPPINQLLFYISYLLGSQTIIGSIVILRLIIIAADVGILYFGSKLLSIMKLPKSSIFWYLLNPLVILEVTGNLHFEGVMLFFFVWAMYLLSQNKWVFAAVILSLSISTKLLPLLLLPLFLNFLGWKKSFIFYTIVVGLNILYFLPFLSTELIQNYTETIGLWFTNFEFNASIYYIIREIGFQFVGYNIIQTTGKIMPVLVILFILFRTFGSKNNSIANLFLNFLIVITVYLFLSTTVHPWYVINLILICVFTKYKFPLIWSLTIILSYFAYSNATFQENNYLLVAEYLVVIGCIIYEIQTFSKNKKNSIFSLEK